MEVSISCGKDRTEERSLSVGERNGNDDEIVCEGIQMTLREIRSLDGEGAWHLPMLL